MIFYQFPRRGAFANGPLHVPFQQSHTSCQQPRFNLRSCKQKKALPFMAGLEASHSAKFASACEFHLDEYLDEVAKEDDDRRELCDGE